MESDSKSDNIILGPWNGSGKKPPKKILSKKDKVQLDKLSNILLIGCEGNTDQEMYQKLINQ